MRSQSFGSSFTFLGLAHTTLATLAACSTAFAVACGGPSFDDGDGADSGATVSRREGVDAGADAGKGVVATTSPSPDTADDGGEDGATSAGDAGRAGDAAADARSADAEPTPSDASASDAGFPDTGPPDACATAQPDTVHGLFVSATATATTACGSVDAPCKTIASGIAEAARQNKTIVYLDKGTYDEQVSLTSGITLEGGLGLFRAGARGRRSARGPRRSSRSPAPPKRWWQTG